MNAKSVKTSLGKARSNSAQLRNEGDAMCTRWTTPSRISTQITSSPCGASAQPNPHRSRPRQAGLELPVASAQLVDRLAQDPQRLRELTEADIHPRHRVTLAMRDDPQAQRR